jgi:hypothetical protein
MKKLHVLILAVALLALTGADCFITSAQVLATFDLPNPVVIDASDNMEEILVDLSSIDDYEEHKDKLEGLTDLAILGTFVNTAGPAGTVEVYISADHNATFADAAAVVAGATRLWGPASIGAAGTPEGTVTLGWDESAALFDTAGRDLLIDEAKGDGRFKIFTVGTPGGTYEIEIQDGFLVLVLDGGV